jgi:hypothetical protein
MVRLTDGAGGAGQTIAARWPLLPPTIWRISSVCGNSGRRRMSPPPKEVKMDRAYVSEFTIFMERYLKLHPEVVKDQERGLNSGRRLEADPGVRREAPKGRVLGPMLTM